MWPPPPPPPPPPPWLLLFRLLEWCRWWCGENGIRDRFRGAAPREYGLRDAPEWFGFMAFVVLGGASNLCLLFGMKLSTPVTDCTSHCFSRQTTVAPTAKVSAIRNENESFFAFLLIFRSVFVYDCFVHCVYPFEMVFFLFCLFFTWRLEVLSLRFGACRTLLHSF